MNPIVLAALHGYAKGYAFGRGAGSIHPAQAMVFGPIKEELSYRGGLAATTAGFADWASAAAFAFSHFDPTADHGMRNFKMLDAFAGGLLYAKAFREYGLFGAVAAHAIHNMMTMAGAGERKRR